MSKKAKVYCDKCGTPRGLESVAIKELESCEFCGKSKLCNVIKRKKTPMELEYEADVKMVNEANKEVEQKKEKPKKKAASKPTAKKTPEKKSTSKKK